MPFSTSSRVLAVRYMHMPRPNSKKWMFHDSSFIFSLAWGSSKQGVCSATPPLLRGLGWCYARHCPRRPWDPVGGWKPTLTGQAGCSRALRRATRGLQTTPLPHNARACTAVGLPAWAYPLGAQVLHGRISLEEFEQPLGGGWRLLCTAPLEATEG